jgi:hypothetical protein
MVHQKHILIKVGGQFNCFVDSSPLPLICNILIIIHSSKIFAWILLFSLVCFSPLLAARFLNDAKQIKTLLWPYWKKMMKKKLHIIFSNNTRIPYFYLKPLLQKQ